MGAVFDRWASEPERRGRGSRYQAFWRDENGRQRKKAFARKGDAVRFLREVERALDRGLVADPSAGAVAFSEFATGWLAGAVHLRDKTVSDYESIIRNHLVPAFGGVSLNRLRGDHGVRLVADLRSRGYRDSTISKVLRVASTLLNAAVADQRVAANPFAHVKRPPDVRRELRVLSPTELGLVLDRIDPHYRCFVLCAAVLGLRFGELAGLHPSNVDLEGRRIYVVEQLSRGAGVPVRGRLKTRASQRSVALPSRLVSELARHRDAYSTAQYVFPSVGGMPIRHSNFLRRHWHPAVKAAGLVGVRFHDLRHASAAWAIAAGAPATLIQQRLGHASVSTTLNVYAHLLPGLDEQLADRLDETVADAVAPQVLPKDDRGTPAVEDEGPDMGDLLGFYRWARRDLNPRPPPCKGGALAI